MITLDLLAYKTSLQTRHANGITTVFDPVRARWITITPEELVRQLFILHTINSGTCPKGLIAVEKQILVNGRERRYDIAFHDRNGLPWLVVECKAPDIRLTQEVVDQIGRYNLQLQVPYLVITNGIAAMCFAIDFKNENWSELDRIPTLDEYISSQ